MELCIKGSLQVYLQKEKDSLNMYDLLKMCLQCASGMGYLASRKIIHRDLSARNVLVAISGDKRIVKISDFGLARLTETQDYYRSADTTEVPVKWCSPEVLKFSKYTEASDVWSYGVTSWEIFEYGKPPWSQYSNKEVLEAVNLRNEKLAKPVSCPDLFYALLLKCWAKEPEDRPNFEKVFEQGQEIYNEIVPETEKDKYIVKPQPQVEEDNNGEPIYN